jgi:hypothetical protein
MSFKVSLYMTRYYNYKFAYPVDSNKQDYDYHCELPLPISVAENFIPTWENLPMFDKMKFINRITEDNYVMLTDEHQCREVAVNKGITYSNIRSSFTPIYRNSYLTMENYNPIPTPFTRVVSEFLLKPYNVNNNKSGIYCNLEDDHFGVGMYLNDWRKWWLSLLSYFSKYGEFLYEIAFDKFGNQDQYSLSEIIETILDSWSGQVGFYTAFGLWGYAQKNSQVINGMQTYRGEQYNGIHAFMDDLACSYQPTLLIDFCNEYGLSLDRVSKRFITNYKDRLEAAKYRIPWWFINGYLNDAHLADSPEYADFMGWSDDVENEYRDDYYHDDDYDFEEGW